jgi:alpha-beta hydrolase superfamily lysophospholipase
MSTITVGDGITIYNKDWGERPVVTCSHGWPLSSDAWDGQMLFLAQNGFGVVAHDRRGHGRSSEASFGNDMNGYADGLASVIEALDLKDVTLVGHSTGEANLRDTLDATGRSGLPRWSSSPLYPDQLSARIEDLSITRLGQEANSKVRPSGPTCDRDSQCSFYPDNISVRADGMLIVTAMDELQSWKACVLAKRSFCETGFTVMTLDPVNLT